MTIQKPFGSQHHQSSFSANAGSMDRNIVSQKQNRIFRKTGALRLLGCAVLTLCVWATPVAGQSPQQKKFDSIFADWKAAATTATVAGGKFSVANRDEAAELRDTWRKSVAEANRHLQLLIPVAIELFETTEKPSEDLVEFIIRIVEDDFNKGRYDSAFELSGMLLDKADSENQRVLLVRMSSAVMSNRFAEAKKLRDEHTYLLSDENLQREVSVLIADIDNMIEMYEKETEIREQEAQADDLPRVSIKTTKGTIEIELFENEAPETVGNFIYLVENGVYKEIFFHRTINHFMAQTGGINSRGQRLEVGYTIYDECEELDARMHFRGSLSMAKTGEPHSGNSQFFFNFVPTPFLNNRHTVFGRVIKGWDALDRITRTHEITENGEEKPFEAAVPDRILSAKVIRKRDHEYKPVRVD